MSTGLVWDLERMSVEVREQARILKRGLSPSHLLMAEWIIQNPGGTLAEMGAFFGYSVSWLCQVINSDMFKAHLASRVKDIQAVVTQDVPEKMHALAAVACDKMMETLNTTTDPEIVKDSFDKVMHRYGYAPNARTGIQPPGAPAIGQQNNVFYLTPDQFQKTQEKYVGAHVVRPALEHKPDQNPEDAKLPEPAHVKTV